LKVILSQPLCSKRNHLQYQELCLGGTNQSQFPIYLSGTVLTAYLPEAKRNKTGVLCRVCEKSYLNQLSILLKNSHCSHQPGCFAVNDRRQHRCNEPPGRKLCDNLYVQGSCALVKVAITLRCVGQANGSQCNQIRSRYP
jgi:hypothetical protein